MHASAFVLLVIVAFVAAGGKDPYKDSIVCLNNKISFKPEVYVEHLNKNCAGKKDGKCTLFCHSENVTPYGYKVLGPDGVPTKEGYLEFINASVLKSERDRVTKHVYGCVDKHATKVDINDSKCDGAGEFYDCINQLWSFDCQA